MTDDGAGGRAHAFVIGWPISHSRSPLIHGHWLTRYGLAGSYEKIAVAPDELPAFVQRLRDGAFVGGNVTVPHKETALSLADEADEAARAIGAANTLWVRNRRVMASNTDAYGFMAHLEASVGDWRDASQVAVVLGAGGAARAICYGLLSAGVSEVRIVNRTVQRARALAESLINQMKSGAGLSVRSYAWDDLPEALSGAGLVVNSTSLGMTGQPPLVASLDGVRSDAIVYDIVYAPLETALLADARARGLRTVDGLGMLLHQAVPGFEKWFGVRPEVTRELRDVIVDDLKADA